MQQHKRIPSNIALSADESAVVILDQTALPNRTEYIELRSAEEMFDAILCLKVRGAPAIGICAAFCYFVLANKLDITSTEQFIKQCNAHGAYLNTSRPTAVNLSWAIKRMDRLLQKNQDKAVLQLKIMLKEEAISIQQEDIAMCASIAKHGLTLLKDGDGILTHCNAGEIATSLYGTALGPLMLGKEQGMEFRVFADETRPLLQGARLTSYELFNAGIDVTLICDNMASIVMKNGWIDTCFIGCDRIARNGDTANKIGSSGVAILAKHYGIPFYVLGPSSTVDLACATGKEIEIELRDPEEIRTKFYLEPMAPLGVKCYNPAFDVVDNSLISGIVTEHGIVRPPYLINLSKLLDENS